ncbi:MAG: hypothetical protein JO356_11595, partial [Acidobacteria bacterium]|nr:hypothetical protein [Acidobacteriota bacterium]
MSSAGLPRHIQIRRHYDRNRYMRHLTQDELNVRIRDVFLNMLRLTPEGKVSVPPIDDAFAIWNEKWTHVLEEMQLRHGPYPSGFTRDILHREPFPDLVSELARKAAKVMSEKGLARGQVFIKFGQRKHMEALHLSGQLRVQPASGFANKAFNPAVRDDELALNIALFLTRDQILKVVKNPEDVPADAPDQRVDMQF